MECPDCGKEIHGPKCRCGWSESPPMEKPSADRPKCCLCRNPVEPDGSCTPCQAWPIGITPRRTCPECGKLVDAEGFCRRCLQYTRTQMLPTKGQWIDTGKISVLLSREENQRRMQGLVAQMVASMTAHQPTDRDLEVEKANLRAIAEMQRQMIVQGLDGP